MSVWSSTHFYRGVRYHKAVGGLGDVLYYFNGNKYYTRAAVEEAIDRYLRNQAQQEQQAAAQEQAASYATKIMDKAVSAGLEHQKFIEQQQEGIVSDLKGRLANIGSDRAKQVRDLSEAGTASILQAQRQAMATATRTLAARGILGSSTTESALAKIGGETAGKLGALTTQVTQDVLQREAERERTYLSGIAQILSIPALEGYKTLADAGLAAAQFAIPNTTTSGGGTTWAF